MKGFTLIETMIAITILTLSVAGPLFVASRAIISAQIARDQLTASYLAQEGVEYVRAVRDNKFLVAHPGDTSGVWGDFLASISGCNATTNLLAACTYDPGGPSLASCTIGSCAQLNLAPLSDGTIAYTQQSGTATDFTRTIQAFDTSANEESIVSKVSWSYHNIPYSVTIVSNLTPWQ